MGGNTQAELLRCRVGRTSLGCSEFSFTYCVIVQGDVDAVVRVYVGMEIKAGPRIAISLPWSVVLMNSRKLIFSHPLSCAGMKFDWARNMASVCLLVLPHPISCAEMEVCLSEKVGVGLTVEPFAKEAASQRRFSVLVGIALSTSFLSKSAFF